jgi:predicted PurR-regulated permease PerM
MPKRTTRSEGLAADAVAARAPMPAVSAHFSTDAEVADAAVARTFRRQIGFWVGAFVLLVLFLYMFSSILLPFAAGMILAYFLDPVADRLEAWLGSRLIAAVVILLAFVVTVVVALMVIVPILATQGADLISKMPDYLARLQSLITSIDPEWLKQHFGVDPTNLRSALNSLVSQGAGFVATIFESIWSSGLALVNVAGLIVVTPVVAFYMLVDWDRMVAKVDSWIPRDHVETVRAIATDINTATAGFLRGQGTLCLILGVMYAIGLTIAGLNFGLLIGLFAGLISFIPYVGSLVGLVLAVGVALVQFWPDWIMVAAVAGIFFLGQFVEGNILQPKLVGESVGLHPVWLMFALLAFGSLFGFVGLLIAVPAAAAVAVLVRFVLGRYLQSPLYRGHRTDAPLG